MGGGMRQSGYLAAAGIYALDHHIDRLKEDHYRARTCAKILSGRSWVKAVNPVPTNIVLFSVADHLKSAHVVEALAQQNIRCAAVNDRLVRWVFHLDIDNDMVSDIIQIVDNMNDISA
jgi:threonine aldolase